MFVPSCRQLNYLFRKNHKIKKPAAPICLPLLLDGLGSREVFLLKRHGSKGLRVDFWMKINTKQNKSRDQIWIKSMESSAGGENWR